MIEKERNVYLKKLQLIKNINEKSSKKLTNSSNKLNQNDWNTIQINKLMKFNENSDIREKNQIFYYQKKIITNNN